METRQPFIVRLPLDKHRALKGYCRRYRYPMQVVVENLIDQLLAQVTPGRGDLDGHQDDHEPPDDDDHDAP